MRILSGLLPAVICAGLIACTLSWAAEPAAGTSTTATPERLAELKQRFQSGLDAICQKYSVPGMTAAYALPDGTVVAFASGLADKEAGTKMTLDTRMPAGSVGKTFVAAVAVGLVQDGKLAFDDPISKWLGDEPWFGDLPNGREITVRHLLRHRSGLTDHVNDPRFAKKVREMLTAPGADPDAYLTSVEMAAFLLQRKPLFAPGKGYAYTDTGYILLGMIIERAGEAPYYDQLRQRFLEPLELTLTLPADRRDLPGVAAGYMPEKNPLGLPPKTTLEGKLRFNPLNEWTGGGLVSNPQDLVRWATALYQGRALGKPYLDELLATDPLDNGKPSRYGLGVFVRDDELGVNYGHGGWFPGYLTHMAYYPAERVAVAVQVNSDARRELVVDVTALIKDVLATVGKQP
ncbi:MAG: serine hydrolase domain-containing protein [Pirellulales bacterium]